MSYRYAVLDIQCSQTIDSVAGVLQTTHDHSSTLSSTDGSPRAFDCALNVCVYRTHTLEGCLSEYGG